MFQESGSQRVLSAQDLLSGSRLTHDIEIPARVLHPRVGEAGGAAETDMIVRMRPLSVGTLALISRASREDVSLIPLLMIKEALIEPIVSLEQVRQMHIGLVHFLVTQAYLISGLSEQGDTVQDAAQSANGAAYLLLAKHFGWTPEQVSQLTPGQVAVYLAGIERLLRFEMEGE
jgi:hypothetical protein